MNFCQQIKTAMLFVVLSLCCGAVAQTSPTNLGPIRTTFQDDVGRATAPANPGANVCRRYFNTTTGVESWLNSSGANCLCGTSSTNSIVYVGANGSISCQSGASVGPGNENSIELPDNTTVANPATGSMKIAPLLGIPNLWEGATLLGQIETASNVGVANGVAGLDGSAVVPITQLTTNQTNCDASHAQLGNRTCGTLSSSLPSVPTNQVLAGPSAYGAAAATATGRAVVPQDFPAAADQCPLDNAICTSSVDANGNPNFLATVASLALPINGGTTPLVAFIAGKYQSLTSNITITLPGSAGIYFIYVNQDLANANLVSTDFGSTNIAPIYSKVAPTKVAAATSTNPQLWFDLSTNTMRANTAGTGGSFVAAPAIVLGAVNDTATQIDQVLCEPFRLDPNTRYRIFKDATDGAQTVTSGTTTKQGEFHYSAFEMTGGTYTPGGAVPYSNVVFSQNVVILMPGATFGGAGQGNAGAGTNINNGSTGTSLGFGGNGGGGGGGTGKTGGAGGAKTVFYSTQGTAGANAGGAAGANNGTAGSAVSVGTNAPSLTPSYFVGCSGSTGGGGGGDGTNPGGGTGAGGSYEHIIAPAVLVAGSAKVQADGGTPATPVAGNVGGGGGGGGGCAFIHAGYVNGTTANVTANGGGAGTHFGATVGDGGAGGAGIAKIQSIL